VFGVTPQAGGHGLLFVNGGVSALDLPSPDACHGPAASRRGRAGSALSQRCVRAMGQCWSAEVRSYLPGRSGPAAGQS